MEQTGYPIKQAVPRTAENMARVMGDVSWHVARKMLADTKMPPGSSVHDAACGNGIITKAIMETQDVANIDKLYATDIGPTMCEATKKVVEAGPPGWAEKTVTEVMPCENLKFADNTFSHSYAGFVIFAHPDPDKVASEMYRTLKTGGSYGYVTTWHRMPHMDWILKAHTTTRSPDSKHRFQKPDQWSDPDYVQSTLEKAGFGVKMSKVDTVQEIENTKEWCTLLWGFLGTPVGGWVKEDEDRFDEAVNMVIKSIETSESFTPNGKGGGAIKMVANLATLHKK